MISLKKTLRSREEGKGGKKKIPNQLSALEDGAGRKEKGRISAPHLDGYIAPFSLKRKGGGRRKERGKAAHFPLPDMYAYAALRS